MLTDAQFNLEKICQQLMRYFVYNLLLIPLWNKEQKYIVVLLIMRKAIDFVNRRKLWYKMIKHGVDGKMLNIIRSRYEKVKCCVKYKGCISDMCCIPCYFPCMLTTVRCTYCFQKWRYLAKFWTERYYNGCEKFWMNLVI